MTNQKLIFLLIISLASQPAFCFLDETFRHIERKFLINLTNLVEVLCRLYEQYILRTDEVLYKTDTLAGEEYDFIIVGAGSAGCVLANRLSEISEWKVLVLEAGPPETVIVDIPIVAMGLQAGLYDWSYLMEKQPNVSFGMKDQQMDCPRGKGLGGSSLLNYMIFSRGSKYDYDKWAAMGNEGWSYEDVLPYFLKSEGANLDSKVDWRYHNRSGPLSVENTYQSLLIKSIISGGEEIGIPYVDYNAPTEPFGFAPVQTTTRNGKRFSTAKAYLAPAANRPNLDIITDALVTRVLIDPPTKHAYGVQYEKNGITYTVQATKEIILSAGSINSAQLLMISGVGPKEHLAEMNIPIIEDLPVGKHFFDHLTFYGLNFLIYYDWDQTDINYVLSIPEFVLHSTGPLTTIGGVEGLGFIKTKAATYSEDVPDIEIMFLRGSVASDHGIWMKTAMRISDEAYEGAFEPIENIPSWLAAPVLLQPKSEGEVKLRSANPHDAPRIIPNYYTDKNNDDIKTMVAGIRELERLVDTSAFRSNGAEVSPYPVGGCEHHVFDSFDYWECALRAISHTLYHPMGTCKMGPPGDNGGVVSEELRVYGIEGLRVVDAGIIPLSTGHPNSVTVMIAEKAADMIKRFNGKL